MEPCSGIGSRTAEKRVISLGRFGVGVAVEDIDSDGRKEVVVGKASLRRPRVPNALASAGTSRPPI